MTAPRPQEIPTILDSGSIPDEYLSQRPRLNPVDLRAVDYVGSYDHNLMCAICHCPFVAPVRLSCEHVFCQRCVNQAFNHQSLYSRSCPSCRRTMDLPSINPVPKILDRILDDLLVRCPLRAEGCLEEMPRCQLQDHLDKYCPFHEVDCPCKECSLTVQRKDIDETRCLHYSVECGDCKRSIMKRDWEHHRNLQCELGRTVCPDCNGKSLFVILKPISNVVRIRLFHAQQLLMAATSSLDASISTSISKIAL